MTKENDSVQSIERAFRILELMRASNSAFGVNDIASQLGLSTTTTHRLLQTLIGVHAVTQNPKTRLYDLNPHLLFFGKAVLNRFDFLSSIHPILGELSKIVGETVFMGILDDQFDLVYIDHVDNLDHPLRMTPQIGLRQPSHCTSLGKVLLANLSIEKQAVILSRESYPKRTDNTITTAQQLKIELEHVRNVGFALDQEETENGICCVAAPISNSGGVIAAVSISGPAGRMRAKGLDTSLKEAVCSTASQVSQLLHNMDLRG
jgi:IclR family transcriptional regulator, KDG regulon repressor